MSKYLDLASSGRLAVTYDRLGRQWDDQMEVDLVAIEESDREPSTSQGDLATRLEPYRSRAIAAANAHSSPRSRATTSNTRLVDEALRDAPGPA